MEIKNNNKGNTQGKIYFYDKVGDYNLIDKVIKDDFKMVCKKLHINKGNLIEKLYKLIILRHRGGTLNSSNGYITIKVL